MAEILSHACMLLPIVIGLVVMILVSPLVVIALFLGNSCISWLSKKQPTVATSSCEAEYRAVFTATVECIWLRRLLMDLCMEIDVATRILTDSQSALAVARNPVFHA